MEEGRAPAQLEFATRPPGIVSAPLGRLVFVYGLLVCAPTLVHVFSGGGGPFGEPAPLSDALIGLAGLGAIVFALWVRLRPLALAPVQLFDDEIRLPLSEASSRTARVRFKALDWLEHVQRGSEDSLRFGIRSGPIVTLHAHTLKDPSALSFLMRSVREHLGARYGGEVDLGELDRRANDYAKRRGRRPWVASTLVLVITAIWLLQVAIGAESDPFSIVRYGGNSPALVANGEWFRLAVANLLHGSALHAYWNIVTIGLLGARIETALGHAALASIAGVGALAGALVSALIAAGLVSVGSSTAVFALIGCYVYLNARYPRDVPPTVRIPIAVVGIALAAVVLSTLLVSQVDHGGHAGGFVGGVIATAVVTRRNERSSLVEATPGRAQALAAVVALLFSISLVSAERSASRGVEESFVGWAEALAADGPSRPHLLNEVAWTLAITPDLPADKLQLARAAAERAHALDPEADEIRDTLATALYRVGELERAIALERELAEETDSGFFWSQLARFEAAYAERWGPLRLGRAWFPAPTVVDRRLVPKGHVPFEAHVLVFDDDGLRGIAIVHVGLESSDTIPLALPDDLPESARFKVALTDASARPLPRSKARYVALDPEAAKLP